MFTGNLSRWQLDRFSAQLFKEVDRKIRPDFSFLIGTFPDMILKKKKRRRRRRRGGSLGYCSMRSQTHLDACA